MEQLERNYNLKFKILVNLLVEKNKKDLEILKLRDEFESVKNHTPNQIIQASGPRLWKYREHIAAGNVAYFLGDEFSDDEAKDYVELIARIQKMYKENATEAERALVVKTAKGLLSIYAQYALLEKKEKNL